MPINSIYVCLALGPVVSNGLLVHTYVECGLSRFSCDSQSLRPSTARKIKFFILRPDITSHISRVDILVNARWLLVS